MLYPLKFKPIYKDYLWGGRNLSRLGKDLPEGIIAESWEVSCHPDGESIIRNGKFKEMKLSEIIKILGHRIMGTDIPWEVDDKFPLLVKLIDASNKLSVQVHPDDGYASLHENDKSGKSEMWYIIWAEQGSKLVYGVKPGTHREAFKESLEEGTVEEYLNYIEISTGDVIDIPAGMVHAIGEGILLVEVQQNSNNTYRVYDYNRKDKDGKRRPLHIQKALDVINFSDPIAAGGSKTKENIIFANGNYKITGLVKNKYFATELYDIKGKIEEMANGERFYIYVFIEGTGYINYGYKDSSKDNVDKNHNNDELMEIKAGESLLIPASMGKYKISGNVKAIRTYVP